MAGIKLTMSVDKENVSFQEEVVDVDWHHMF